MHSIIDTLPAADDIAGWSRRLAALLGDKHGFEGGDATPAIPAEAIRSVLTSAELTDPRGLAIRGVRVEGVLDLDSANVQSKVEFSRVQFDDEVWLDAFHGRDLFFLECGFAANVVARHARVEGRLLVLDSVFLRGAFDATGAILGELDISGSRFARVDDSSPASVCLNVSSIAGDLSAVGAEVDGRLSAIGVEVRGSMLASRASFLDPNVSHSVMLDSARIGGVLDLREVSAASSIAARGVGIDGQLQLQHAILRERQSGDQPTLDFDSCRIDKGALLEGVRTPRMSMSGASVKYLDLTRVQAGGRDRASVYLDNVTVDEDVQVAGAEFSGILRLRGAQVGRSLDSVTGQTADGPGTRIAHLDLTRASITGDVQFGRPRSAGGGREGRLVQGISVSGVSIGGVLNLSGLEAVGAPGSRVSLSARGAHIHHLQLAGREVISGGVDLREAIIEHLEMVDDTGAPPPVVAADGLQLSALSGGFWSSERNIIGWLRSSGGNVESQPWLPVAAALENAGEDRRARKLRFTSNDLRRKGSKSRFVRAWRPITKWTVGHGFHLEWSMVWLVGLFLLALVIVGLNQSSFTPTDRSAALLAVDPLLVATGVSPSPAAYPAFNPALYALDVVLFPVGTGQGIAWWASGVAWLSLALAGIKVASWILLGLFVSGATGLLNRNR